MDDLTKLTATLAPLVASVLGATEVIGRALKVNKDLVAMTLGPIAGVVAHAMHWITVGAGWPGYCGAAFVGLTATLVAQLAKDKLIGPVVAANERRKEAS